MAIVMEFLEGEDLSDYIRRKGRVSDEECKELFAQILTAFGYAHKQGIIHRDITPSNIYILKDGTVKILDFGIAKIFAEGNEMTQTGTQIGTPVYMSPEQVRAEKGIDKRSDIYSLGVTLYYALNGTPPYDGNTTSQFVIQTKIVNDPLPELSVSSTMKTLVDRACQKDRALRFQNCDEWLEALNSGKAPAKADANKTSVDLKASDRTIVEAPTIDKTVVETKTENRTVLSSGNKENLKSIQNPLKEKKSIGSLVMNILALIGTIIFLPVIILIANEVSYYDYHEGIVQWSIIAGLGTIFYSVFCLITYLIVRLRIKTKTVGVLSIIGIVLCVLIIVWSLLMISSAHIDIDEVYPYFIIFALINLSFLIKLIIQIVSSGGSKSAG
jgi:serine/threonine protein kinase